MYRFRTLCPLLTTGLLLLGCTHTRPLSPQEAERLLLRAEVRAIDCLRLLEMRFPSLRGALRLPPDRPPELPADRLLLAYLGTQVLERLRVQIPDRPFPELLDIAPEHPYRGAILTVLRAGLLEPFPNQTFRPSLLVDGHEVGRFLDRLKALAR
jgi:hypothetical protein|nr:MAG: hypothetical protein KatS3mg041_1328 [Bacteroidota bacterium]